MDEGVVGRTIISGGGCGSIWMNIGVSRSVGIALLTSPTTGRRYGLYTHVTSRSIAIRWSTTAAFDVGLRRAKDQRRRAVLHLLRLSVPPLALSFSVAMVAVR